MRWGGRGQRGQSPDLWVRQAPGPARTGFSCARRAGDGLGQAGQHWELEGWEAAPAALATDRRPGQPPQHALEARGSSGTSPGGSPGGQSGFPGGFSPSGDTEGPLDAAAWDPGRGKRSGLRRKALCVFPTARGRVSTCPCVPMPERLPGHLSVGLHACPRQHLHVSTRVHSCTHVRVPVVSCGVPGIWVTYALLPMACAHGSGGQQGVRLGSGSQDDPG